MRAAAQCTLYIFLLRAVWEMTSPDVREALSLLVDRRARLFEDQVSQYQIGVSKSAEVKTLVVTGGPVTLATRKRT